jgi:radical SAM protein with 4Fe4S-binding SPASM domain
MLLKISSLYSHSAKNHVNFDKIMFVPEDFLLKFEIPEIIYGLGALSQIGQCARTLWRGPMFHSFRQLEIASCKNCYRFDLCLGGCSAIVYHTHRKLGLADPGCLDNCAKEKSSAAVGM